MDVRDVDLSQQEQEWSPFAKSSSSEPGRAPTACDFALVVWDSGGVIRLANQLASDLGGTSLEAIIGRSLLDVVTTQQDFREEGAEGARAVNVLGPKELVKIIAAGELDNLRGKVLVRRPGRGAVPAWAWTRSVELDGGRGAVSLVVPIAEVGRLGRDTSVPWRELASIAVGVASSRWVIETVSAETRLVLGLAAEDCVGSSLLDLVHKEDVGRLRWLASGQSRPVGSRCHIRFAHRDGGWVEACVLVAPVQAGTGEVFFAVVGPPERSAAWTFDRVTELELRLRHIAAEVRAAGVPDDLGRSPAPSDHPALRELTTRQREILARIVRGQRVPTIADELFLSRSTVRSHLATIFRKFAVHSQPELLELLRQRPRRAASG